MACICGAFCRLRPGLSVGLGEAAAAHHEHRVAAANGPSHPEARRHALPPAEPAHARLGLALRCKSCATTRGGACADVPPLFLLSFARERPPGLGMG